LGTAPYLVLVESASGHQHVDVGMLFQGAGPGVEHCEDAELAADELPVAAKFQGTKGT
jgi:hypothetical protein